MSNILNIPSKYMDFFVRNYDERFLILQGGRRSGKTFSTFMFLYLLCSGKDRLHIQVAAPTYSLLQATIQDFQDCLGLPVQGSKLMGDYARTENGSVFEFISYDKPEKAVGRKCDYLFLNESIFLPESVFITLVQGVRQGIILNYNPVATAWSDKYVAEDKHNFLITTWRDNPYLTEYQKEEFENLKRRALSPTATILDTFYYKTYYLGEFSDMGGKVFKVIHTCTDEEFDRIDSYPSLGLDFGFTDGGDETAMTSVKIHDNCLYIKQLIYSKFLGRDEDLDYELKRIGIKQTDSIVADFGGLGKTRIYNLRDTYGWDIMNCHKNKVIDDLQQILQFDKIIVTESSVDLRKELENYELTPEGKPKNGIADHCVDSARYGFNFAKVNQLY